MLHFRRKIRTCFVNPKRILFSALFGTCFSTVGMIWGPFFYLCQFQSFLLEMFYFLFPVVTNINQCSIITYYIIIVGTFFLPFFLQMIGFSSDREKFRGKQEFVFENSVKSWNIFTSCRIINLKRIYFNMNGENIE